LFGKQLTKWNGGFGNLIVCLQTIRDGDSGAVLGRNDTKTNIIPPIIFFLIRALIMSTTIPIDLASKGGHFKSSLRFPGKIQIEMLYALPK
jgi:hypothetical protein